MAQFHVTVVRTITTTLVVDADNARDARRKIEDYGVVEAWSDFEHTDESATEKVKGVTKAP